MSVDNQQELISPLDILHLYKSIREISDIQCADKYIISRCNQLKNFIINDHNNKILKMEEFLQSPNAVMKNCLSDLKNKMELRAWQYIFGLLPNQYNIQSIINHYDDIILLPIQPLSIKVNNNSNNNNISRYYPVKTTTPPPQSKINK